jgi:thiaminase/transcriptional activator TenA
MSIFSRLKAAAADDWTSYVDHDFVLQLGDGTLPQAAFRVKAAQAGLASILDEMELHVRLCGRWGLSPAEIEAAPEHQATVAYTRFVLDCGAAGDLLDLHVALAPCVIGYAEIGSRLAPNGAEALGAHPYREWIGEYAGEGYQAVAARARRHLDDLAARAMTEQRFVELAALFGKASRLEADFWQMGLAAALPPR